MGNLMAAVRRARDAGRNRVNTVRNSLRASRSLQRRGRIGLGRAVGNTVRAAFRGARGG